MKRFGNANPPLSFPRAADVGLDRRALTRLEISAGIDRVVLDAGGRNYSPDAHDARGVREGITTRRVEAIRDEVIAPSLAERSRRRLID